ncbi:hypothetical protein OG607_05030 [Streptomyces sp. NBC_01537]|uniref:hypothetical protein n=1 Tax=Streptomyces sp. NBC_01537 TaxID=2903896 RepID=UPI00386467CA
MDKIVNLLDTAGRQSGRPDRVPHPDEIKVVIDAAGRHPDPAGPLGETLEARRRTAVRELMGSTDVKSEDEIDRVLGSLPKPAYEELIAEATVISDAHNPARGAHGLGQGSESSEYGEPGEFRPEACLHRRCAGGHMTGISHDDASIDRHSWCSDVSG